MRLDVHYRDGEPRKITTAGHGQTHEWVFTIEGDSARLVDARATEDVPSGHSAVDLMELNHAHDAVLGLPFIARVTVWMKGRTDTELEDTER